MKIINKTNKTNEEIEKLVKKAIYKKLILDESYNTHSSGLVQKYNGKTNLGGITLEGFPPRGDAFYVKSDGYILATI